VDLDEGGPGSEGAVIRANESVNGRKGVSG
jgi:hypothetical protein